eukprot:403370773
MGLPGQSSGSPFSNHVISRNLKDFRDLDGTYLIRDKILNKPQYSLDRLGTHSAALLYRNLLNPIDFDGSVWQEVKNSYKTNEIGFFISVLFFVSLSWSFVSYRRNSILEQKKRFVYQQYKKQKFIEESLRIKSREELIEEKIQKIEYKQYFKQ